MSFALFAIFCLGVVNFAAHKAVLESGHRLLAQVPWLFRSVGGPISLAVEFAMLLGAMLMVGAGAQVWALFYLAYSLANGLAAWMIVTDRF